MAVDNPNSNSTSSKKKLQKLPSNAKVTKRPLLRPAIPSPYTSSEQPKVVYVSAKTPFMSAVKRIEKLFRLSEKREIQSATSRVRKRRPGKQNGGKKINHDGDDITNIVEELRDTDKKEEVIVKATGKAIPKALEIGLWFQQREQYVVRLKTSSTGAIDDIEIPQSESTNGTALPDTGQQQANEDQDMADAGPVASTSDPVEEQTRIRQVSVIEVRISLK